MSLTPEGTWPTLHIEVLDEGEGIPPKSLSRIFERFYRADSSRARDFGGTGLGLAIVRHLIEGMGGRVEAESVLGTGATIRMVLPLNATTKQLDEDDLLLSAEEEQSDEEEEEEEEDEAYFISEENYQEAYKREMRIWEYWADPERAFGRLGRKGDQGESEGNRGSQREPDVLVHRLGTVLLRRPSDSDDNGSPQSNV